MSQTYTGRIISSISPLLVDLFECFLVFCYLEFKKAISDGCRIENPGIGVGYWILSDFRELGFCGPFGPCFGNVWGTYTVLL